MSKKVKIVNADVAIDGRGELLFCNDFNMSNIKRFYQIKNFKNPFVRAWHGHKFEDKYTGWVDIGLSLRYDINTSKITQSRGLIKRRQTIIN